MEGPGKARVGSRSRTSYEALRAGELDVVSDDYEKVTGRKAATIEQVITELADELPLATSAADF